MKKAELIEKLKQAEATNKLLEHTLRRVLLDYVQIKPTPKGKIKDRLTVFTEKLTFNKNTTIASEVLFLLNGAHIAADLTFTGERKYQN